MTINRIDRGAEFCTCDPFTFPDGVEKILTGDVFHPEVRKKPFPERKLLKEMQRRRDTNGDVAVVLLRPVDPEELLSLPDQVKS